jgi:hypothetical protein
MVTVLREGSFRVRIYTDDHEPAHVHVVGDGMAKVSLVPHVELQWARGMTDAAARKALRLVSENRLFLLEKWRELHG